MSQLAAYVPLLPKAGVMYLSALAGLLVLRGWGASIRSPAWRWQAGAAALFCISLTLRQLDLPLCSLWPYGTHFAWLVLNSLVLYGCARAVLRPR